MISEQQYNPRINPETTTLHQAQALAKLRTAAGQSSDFADVERAWIEALREVGISAFM